MGWGGGRPRVALSPRCEMPLRCAALFRPQSHRVKYAAAAAAAAVPSHLIGLGEHVGDLRRERNNTALSKGA